MTDAEIKSQRAHLQEEERHVVADWKRYDRDFPVIVGGFKPHDYDSKQRDFHRRLMEVRSSLRGLPKTTSEKLMAVLICGGIALLVWAIWKAIR